MDIQSVRRPGEGQPASEPLASSPPDRSVQERAERAAALARYEALLAERDASGAPHCDATNYAKYDLDHCGTEVVPQPVLFARQEKDVQEVDPRDVQQGEIGDCYLMATLWAMTRSPEGRALIQNAIAENRNDQGAVVSYTVTFHRPETHWLGLGRTTFSDVRVTVDGSFAVDHHAFQRADGSRNEVWPLVMEKAYAIYRGGYEAIGRGGVSTDAMQALTGRDAAYTKLWRVLGLRTYGADDLRRDLAAGKIVVLGTRPDAHEHGLQGSHAYAVTGTEMKNGKLCVMLHNPSNNPEPDSVPVDDLERFFHGVDVGAVR
jgi:hypothetical protein